jgi:hypothetical protein
MFETIIADALEIFLKFEDLVTLQIVSKYIQNMFFKFLCKRRLWNSSKLPNNLKLVFRLKESHGWIGYAQLQMFPNLKELQIVGFNSTNMHEIYNFSNNITTLIFGDRFAGVISHLPSKLQRLSFGSECRAKWSKVPETLEQLTFGDSCHVRLNECILPENLIRIEFGKSFYQSLTPLIGLPLKHILVSSWYMQEVPKELVDKMYYKDFFSN